MSNPTTPPRATSAASHSTTFVHEVSSVFASRIRSQVDPLVAQELDGNILPAQHATFLEHALGVPTSLAEEWAPSLAELGERKEIKDFLTNLSNAKNEKARYEPFAKMANFILDEMREKHPLPEAALPDLRFVRNDPTVIKGPLEARTPRKPDIILVRKEIADLLNRKKGDRPSVSWTHILCAIEFKVDTNAAPEDPEETIASGSHLSASALPHSMPHIVSSSRKSQVKASPEPHSITEVALTSQPASRSSSKPKNAAILLDDEPPKKKKRKNAAILLDDEPPKKKTDSGSRTGSVHTGTSGVTHGDFKQLSSYPLEMLSSTKGTREHVLSMFMDGDELQLWFYDRAGTIHSDTRVNFRKDFVAFATVILASARLSLQQFGLLSVVKFKSLHEVPTSLKEATLTLRDKDGHKHVVTLTGDVISSRPGIVGRCSFVCSATCPSISATEVVVKFSFQDVSRVSEVEIIDHARDAGVQYLPLVYLSQDFSRLSCGPRGSLIPMENEALKYQDRVLRIMVSQRYTPVYKLPSLFAFQTVIRNVFECMNQLHVKVNVLHRDISYTNLMAKELPDGSFEGVLIDFDQAIRTDRLSAEGHLSLHRTGTLPFMAMSLLTLEAVQHMFRHDTESLFYVLVWISAHYDGGGRDVHPDALSEWQSGSIRSIAAAKLQFVVVPLMLDALEVAQFYAPLKVTCLKPFHDVIYALHSQWVQRFRMPNAPEIPDTELYARVVTILQSSLPIE